MKDVLLAKLQEFGQEHLLAFWDELTADEQTAFDRQIEAIDFALLAELYTHRNDVIDYGDLLNRATSPPSFKLGEGSARVTPEQACARGEEALRAGKIAAFVVAGGQGTRLGFNHPKGMYPVGAVSDVSLFQIHCEKILAIEKKYGARLPLCIMTGPTTDAETKAFFAENDNFGLRADDVIYFQQGSIPAVDMETGKTLLQAKDQIVRTPDGHGGTLAALANSGTLAELEKRGIESLFYFQIDNSAIDIASPEFLGYHLLSGSEFSSQVVRKQAPDDRVGNVVQIDDHVMIVEYSDLPDSHAEKRNADGSLEIWAGSIAVHVMDVPFLRHMANSLKTKPTSEILPFHVAKKKIPHLDASGTLVKPEDPNGIKFERFIFDLLPHSKNAIVLEVDPKEHFIPLKNAPGAASNTPEWVKENMAHIHRDWLREAGAVVADDAVVEISPLFALGPADLEGMIEKDAVIEDGTYLKP